MDITALASADTNQLLVNLFLTALTLIVSVLSRAVFQNIKTRTNDQQWNIFVDICRTAVYAVESASLGGAIRDKKDAALDIVTKALAERGLNIDPQVIEATIEATVLEEFNRVKLYQAQAAKLEASSEADGTPTP